MLLQKADSKSDEQSEKCSKRSDKPSFVEECSADGLVSCAKVLQDTDVFLLVDDKHGEGSDDVEACDEEDESQQEGGEEFLYFKDTEEIRLLLVAVSDDIPVAEAFSELGFHAPSR